jgi:hypothetical protein
MTLVYSLPSLPRRLGIERANRSAQRMHAPSGRYSSTESTSRRASQAAMRRMKLATASAPSMRTRRRSDPPPDAIHAVLTPSTAALGVHR